ncbi:MAG TPA: DUF3515 family protein [Actinocrinis sp.]|nr:DUF3515 family protein [Actinocrinis sp.]
MKLPHGRTVPAAGAAGAAGLAGLAVWALFGSASAVAVSVPGPVPSVVAADCAKLTKALPQSLLGQRRTGTKPASAQTAAWQSNGSNLPAITLRCGVPEPTMLVSGSKDYDPTSEESYINGVAWLMQQTSDGYRFTAAQRYIFIEVDVPSAYTVETMALPGLAQAVIDSVPRGDGTPGPDTAPLPTPGQ